MRTNPGIQTQAAPASNARVQWPIIGLTFWSVYEVPLYGVDVPWTRHFVGYAEELGLAQVSSSIVKFDRERGHGSTANQRVLRLVGLSGRHQEGARLWDRWKSLNGVQVDRDITAGFFQVVVAKHGKTNLACAAST